VVFALESLATPWRGIQVRSAGLYSFTTPGSRTWAWDTDGPGHALRLCALAIVLAATVLVWLVPRRWALIPMILGLVSAAAVLDQSRAATFVIGGSGFVALPDTVEIVHRRGLWFAMATAVILLVMAVWRRVSRPAARAPATPAGRR
jgi:hypothetical protein